MRIISKSSFLRKFAIYTGVFLFISMILTFVSTKLPERYYRYNSWMYKERNWEKGGEFYQDKFKVRAWKKKLPELADFIKSIFPKKFIKEFQGEFIAKYLMESCKAEFTHWSIIFSTVIFLIFDGITAFISMLFLAIILNFPFIIIQRYNRPRIISIMKHKGTEV